MWPIFIRIKRYFPFLQIAAKELIYFIKKILEFWLIFHVDIVDLDIVGNRF